MPKHAATNCIEVFELIYTLGCSFTRWYWPTWADWLGQYLSEPVTNLAGSGYTNELIYQQLLTRYNKITPEDTVYIMWTGSNRHCVWYDSEYVEQRDCHGFFPDTNGQLWYGDNYRGLYKTEPAHLPSLTHMIMDLFKTVLNTQFFLDRVGCDYHMMFWRNPWADTREQFSPTYSYTWNQKKSLSSAEIKAARDIVRIPNMAALLNTIDWQRFVSVPSKIHDPLTYDGLWEFALNQKQALLLNHDKDDHPNTLIHHDWVIDRGLIKTPARFRSQAQDLAVKWRGEILPDYDRRNEILHCIQ